MSGCEPIAIDRRIKLASFCQNSKAKSFKFRRILFLSPKKRCTKRWRLILSATGGLRRSSQNLDANRVSVFINDIGLVEGSAPAIRRVWAHGVGNMRLFLSVAVR